MYGTGQCTRTGIRVGGPGGYTGGSTTQPPGARKEVPYQRSGPRRTLQGSGVGGYGTGCVRAARTTTPAPLGLPGPLRCPGTSPRAKAASWPIRARIEVIYLKVSQNREVSPKYIEKASHSPYFQNGSQKSPLEILRFPFRPAFSHKELMVAFFGLPLDFLSK